MSFTPLFIDPLQPGPLLLALLAIVFAYAAFSLLGFGSALLASPALGLVLPIARVIPLLAMLDAAGSLSRAWQSRQHIDRAALRILLPCMLLGQIIGVTGLAALPLRWMALLFGGFIIWLGGSALLRKPGAVNQASRHGAVWHGLLGGVLGGLFGSGGFMYARHLQQRLPERQAMRATQAVLIALSTLWRIVLCSFAGLVDLPLLSTALLLAPAAWLGFRLGKQLDAGLSGARWLDLLNAFLVLAGGALLVRYWG